MERKIDLFISRPEFKNHSRQSFEYYCSTIQHKTCRSARESIELSAAARFGTGVKIKAQFAK